MAKDRFKSAALRHKEREQIGRDEGPAKGPWTHKKRQPVRSYTLEEIERFKKERGWK